MVWVCKLSCNKIISIKNNDRKFYDSIIKSMKQEVLCRIKYRRLGELFNIPPYDAGSIHSMQDRDMRGIKRGDIMISIDEPLKIMIVDADMIHSKNIIANYKVNLKNFLLLRPKPSITDVSASMLFLESKYGLLQLHEILCRKIINIESLNDIIIPHFPLSFEEKIERMYEESVKDSKHSKALHAYVMLLVEKYIEKQAGIK